MLVFMNKDNDYQEKADTPWLYSLLFGPFYYAFKGVWAHFFLFSLLAITDITIALSTSFPGTGIIVPVIYAFCAKGIVRKHYLRKGWLEVLRPF